MTANGFQHFTLNARRSLFRMQRAQLGMTEIAARLGRHRFRDPDAFRDSRRNTSGCYPVTAQDIARARRRHLAVNQR